MHEEATLAKVELSEKVSQVATGAGEIATGGAVLFAGFIVLLFAAVGALEHVLPEPHAGWLAPLIVVAMPSASSLWARLHATTPTRVLFDEDGAGLSLLKFHTSSASAVEVYVNGLGQSWLPYGNVHTALGALPAFIHPAPSDVAIIGFGLSNTLWLALLFLALAGGSDMISGVFRSTIWNQTIPDHLRGRLAGIEMLSYTTGPTLGNLESGVAARFVGVSGSIISGGVLCVVGTIALAAALPAFVRYDGREGLSRKISEDEAWAAQAAASPA